jgi:hypothetical protein
MLGRLFPKSFDNTFRGHWLALWLLGAVAAVKILQGIQSMAKTHDTMVRADGIPVDTFPPAAAHEAVSMFALLGLNMMVLPLISLLALVRYRAMAPFLFLAMILVQLGYRVLNALNGATDIHAIGFWVNMGILAVMIVGLVLSLVPGRRETQS